MNRDNAAREVWQAFCASIVLPFASSVRQKASKTCGHGSGRALWRRTYSERLKPRRFCHCRFMPIAAAGRGDAVAMDTEIEMKWKRNGRAGRGVISVKAAGKPLYTEKLDITDRDARNRLIQSICERG